MVSGSPRVRPSATRTGSTSPTRSPTLVSGVASVSAYRSSRCRQLTGRSSPVSAASRRQRTHTGANGSSLISQPATTGLHSSSSVIRVRISRVLPCPRSPSSTRSWPASRAPSSIGSTVSSKPTMPGNAGSPLRSRSSRLARISSLTVRGRYPLSRNAPRVPICGVAWVMPLSLGRTLKTRTALKCQPQSKTMPVSSSLRSQSAVASFSSRASRFCLAGPTGPRDSRSACGPV